MPKEERIEEWIHMIETRLADVGNFVNKIHCEDELSNFKYEQLFAEININSIYNILGVIKDDLHREA